MDVMIGRILYVVFVAQCALGAMTTESWLVNPFKTTLENGTVWTLRVKTTDPRITCSIAARGENPKITVLSTSSESSKVHIINPEREYTSECSFVFTLDNLPGIHEYKTMDMEISEIILDDVDVKVKRARFILSNHFFDDIDNSSVTLGPETTVGHTTIDSSTLVTMDAVTDGPTIALSTTFGDNVLIKSIGGVPTTTIPCSDGHGASANFVQEVNGQIFRRWNDVFERWDLDINDSWTGTDTFNAMMNPSFPCPIGIRISPNYWDSNYVLHFTTTRFSVFRPNDKNPVILVSGFNNITDISFNSKTVNSFYVLTGSETAKTLQNCRILHGHVHGINNTYCETVGTINTTSTFQLSTSSYAFQPQYVFSENQMMNEKFEEVLLDGASIGPQFMTTSPFQTSDVFVYDGSKVLHVAHNGTATKVVDLAVDSALALRFKTTSELAIYYLDSGELKARTVVVDSYYSTSSQVTIKSSMKNLALGFGVDSLSTLQTAQSYAGTYQRFWWLSGSDGGATEPLELEIQNSAVSYQSLGHDMDFTVKKIASGGEAVIITKDLDSNSDSSDNDRGAPEFVEVRYKDDETERLHTVAIPTRVGMPCDDNSIKLEFDYVASRSETTLGGAQAVRANIRKGPDFDVDIHDVDTAELLDTAYTFLHDAKFYPRFKLTHRQTKESFPYTERVRFVIDQVWPIISTKNASDPKIKEGFFFGRNDALSKTSIDYAYRYANGVDSNAYKGMPYGRFSAEALKNLNDISNNSMLMPEPEGKHCNPATDGAGFVCKLGDTSSPLELKWNCDRKTKRYEDSPCDHFINYWAYQLNYREYQELDYVLPFLSPCLIRNVTNAIRSLFVDIREEDLENNCFTPQYLVHINATTVDSTHRCPLKTHFYIRLASVPLTNVSKLAIFGSMLIALTLLVLIGIGMMRFHDYYLDYVHPKLRRNRTWKTLMACITGRLIRDCCRKKQVHDAGKRRSSALSADSSVLGADSLTYPSYRRRGSKTSLAQQGSSSSLAQRWAPRQSTMSRKMSLADAALMAVRDRQSQRSSVQSTVNGPLIGSSSQRDSSGSWGMVRNMTQSSAFQKRILSIAPDHPHHHDGHHDDHHHHDHPVKKKSSNSSRAHSNESLHSNHPFDHGAHRTLAQRRQSTSIGVKHIPLMKKDPQNLFKK